MIEYNLEIGNCVKYRSNRFARIESIDSVNKVYNLTLLREYPTDKEIGTKATQNEIMPIGLWGYKEDFFETLGFKNNRKIAALVDEKNDIAIKRVVIDFPNDITVSMDGFVTIEVARVFLYLIEKTSIIDRKEKEILERAKGVTNEKDLKSFIELNIAVKFVHDIQNFCSCSGIKIDQQVEKALLKFD